MIISARAQYRYPKVLKRRFKFDTYECEWKEGTYALEVKSTKIEDIIEALNKVERPDDCDAMKLKIWRNIDGVDIVFEKGIDMKNYTTIFPDGREVKWTVSENDYRDNTVGDRFNEALAKAGYKDLIIN
jgi:hypothetical protein